MNKIISAMEINGYKAILQTGLNTDDVSELGN